MKLEVPDSFFNDEELKNTPDRWARFLDEWLEKSNHFKFTTFPNEPKVDQMVIQKDINLYSICAHHMLPFFGTAHIGYLPKDKLCGLSKLARAVDKFAHRPQNQERLTQQIADFLMEELDPHGDY